YDYIVVGAGPTGSMVATELARKGFSTLLIDAGKDYMHPNITVPAFQFNTLETEQIQWDYWVKHYDESTGLRQQVLYPKASGLGGCTLHNSLIHVYPNSRDFKEMVELTGDKSWAETTFRKYLETIALYRLVRPGAQVTSDADLEDYIRKTSWGHHATGTMKIGKDDDPNAVLDGNFKVRGVENLRVIDLSVMPNLPGYFPVMFLYLLGMKGADAI
ncbi:FAD/NAD(P)-binding domain-containing protein, partial [Conidiobolus coronatus NRRL 28638]